MAIDFSVIKHKWTDKQLATLTHYATSPRDKRSYIASYAHGYDCSNMKDKTTKTHSMAFFNKPFVREGLALIEAEANKLLSTQMDGAVIDAAWVLKRIALLADFNIKKFIKVDTQGNAAYDFSTATDDDWYCISEYTVEEIAKGKGEGAYFVEKSKIKAVDKVRALELVGKHVKVQAFKEQIETSGVVVNVNMDKSEYKTARKEMLDDDDC